jgi:flavin-binding protein dodecin
MGGIIDAPSTPRQRGLPRRPVAAGVISPLARSRSAETIGMGVDRNPPWTQRAENSPTPQEVTMAVRKSINIAGSGPTIEASVHEAIDRAYTTLEGITRFEVTKISGDLTDSGPVFDVEVTIWFTLLERMHE